MNEGAYQNKVKKLLDERGVYYEVIWGGGFQAAGIPDILAVHKGIFIGLELKVKYNKPSPLQEAKVDLIRRSGGIAAIVWDNLEPVEDILDTIEEAVESDLSLLENVRYKYNTRSDSC